MLYVEIVPENHASIAEIRAQIKQIVAFLADQLDPEGHDLHVAPRACGGDGMLSEVAFDVDYGEDELRIEASS